MPRYADIDKLLETFDENEPMNWNDTESEIQAQRDFEYYRGLVEGAEVADVVEVVRCRDCTYSKEWYADKRLCGIWHEDKVSVYNDGFCSYGERKPK